MTSPRRLKTEALVLMLALSPLACDPSDMDTSDPPPPGRGRGPGPGGGPPGAEIPADELAPRVRELAARFDVRPTPAAPKVDDAMWVLGQALAFDKILSGNGDISCMTCHHPSIGSDDDRSLPLGVGGEGLGSARTGGDIIPRNAPALYNLHAYRTMFWDSRVERRDGELATPAGALEGMLATLEGSGHGLVSAQALFPVTSREEMRGHPGENELADLDDDDVEGIWSALMERLRATPGYPAMFEAAYPGEAFDAMTFAHAANAIAAFEVAAFESRGSPWERFLAGDDSAMSEAQLRGAAAFFGRGCASCHRGVGLSDFRTHNIGMPQFGPGKGDGLGGMDDFGREQVTGDDDDRWEFRTTPLTNVEFTGPYGHTGQFATLRRHIEHYADPEDSLLGYDITVEVSEEGLWGLFVDNADGLLDELSPRLRDVRLREDDPAIDELVVFMQALSDPDAHDLSSIVPERVPSGLPVRD